MSQALLFFLLVFLSGSVEIRADGLPGEQEDVTPHNKPPQPLTIHIQSVGEKGIPDELFSPEAAPRRVPSKQAAPQTVKPEMMPKAQAYTPYSRSTNGDISSGRINSIAAPLRRPLKEKTPPITESRGPQTFVQDTVDEKNDNVPQKRRGKKQDEWIKHRVPGFSYVSDPTKTLSALPDICMPNEARLSISLQRQMAEKELGHLSNGLNDEQIDFYWGRAGVFKEQFKHHCTVAEDTVDRSFRVNALMQFHQTLEPYKNSKLMNQMLSPYMKLYLSIQGKGQVVRKQRQWLMTLASKRMSYPRLELNKFNAKSIGVLLSWGFQTSSIEIEDMRDIRFFRLLLKQNNLKVNHEKAYEMYVLFVGLRENGKRRKDIKFTDISGILDKEQEHEKDESCCCSCWPF